MLVSNGKYNALKLEANAMYERGNAQLEINGELVRKLGEEKEKNEILQSLLTTSRRNLLASENDRKRDQMYFTSHAERDLAEARREISLLRDLVTSQGAIISEVFNR